MGGAAANPPPRAPADAPAALTATDDAPTDDRVRSARLQARQPPRQVRAMRPDPPSLSSSQAALRLRRLQDAGRATLAAFQARRAAAGGEPRPRAADPAAGASAVFAVVQRELGLRRAKLVGGSGGAAAEGESEGNAAGA
jgi:hypothetical protein